MKNALVFPALLGSLLLAPAVSYAQVSDVDRATARTLAQEGQEALLKKDYATAENRFARAESLLDAPTLVLALARAQVGLGKWVAAQESYAHVIREPVPPNAPSAFTKAVAEAQTELAALVPRIPGIQVDVKGPSTPAVTCDGIAIPSAALGAKRPANPGKHILRATADGYVTAEVTVISVEGKTESVVMVMKPVPAQGAPLAAQTTPPPAASTTSAPETKSSSRKTVGIVALSVGAAGLVFGAVTGTVALGKHATITTSCPEGHCPSDGHATLDPQISSYQNMGTLSSIGFIAGGVLAAAGAVLIITAPAKSDDSASPKTGSALWPVLGLGYAGAGGKF